MLTIQSCYNRALLFALLLAAICGQSNNVLAAVNPAQQGSSYAKHVLAGSAAAIAAGLGTKTGRYGINRVVKALGQAKSDVLAGARSRLEAIKEAIPSISIGTAARQREIATRTQSFRESLYNNNIGRAQELAREGNIDVNMFVNIPNSVTMLHEVAASGKRDHLITLLTLNPDVNVKDIKGDTPLHLIIKRFGYVDLRPDALEMLNLLLERGGIAVNKQNNEGLTPLHLAAEIGNKDAVDALLKKGADVNIRDNKGKTAAEYALENNHPEVMLGLTSRSFVSELLGLEPAEFFATVMSGNVAAVSEWQKQGVFIVDAIDRDGQTGLHYAVFGNKPEMVRFLLEQGADPFAHDANNVTPLHIARDNFELLKLMLDPKYRNNGSSLVPRFKTSVDLSKPIKVAKSAAVLSSRPSGTTTRLSLAPSATPSRTTVMPSRLSSVAAPSREMATRVAPSRAPSPSARPSIVPPTSSRLRANPQQTFSPSRGSQQGGVRNLLPAKGSRRSNGR